MIKIRYRTNKKGCHICISHKPDTNGYPCVRAFGKKVTLARYIKLMELEYDEDVSDLVVRHKCDNRRCVNHKHLMWGTQKQNVHDMIKRRRAKWQK